ncbi:hypothetical protein E2C01_022358 [Portunus trituberculatus]|uniref:Uncharacterized protein n=1 Tax=Portunus trituberculatus TaxID=210409 RepID=A0A5B7E5T2_PORTR|nr:hypothetical protein [Portunus trituberculatus]
MGSKERPGGFMYQGHWDGSVTAYTLCLLVHIKKRSSTLDSGVSVEDEAGSDVRVDDSYSSLLSPTTIPGKFEV